MINKDNYALGTLVFLTLMLKVSDEQVDLIQRITRSIAHLLDLQVDQRNLTAEKIVKAADVFSNEVVAGNLADFKTLLLLNSEMRVSKS